MCLRTNDFDSFGSDTILVNSAWVNARFSGANKVNVLPPATDTVVIQNSSSLRSVRSRKSTFPRGCNFNVTDEKLMFTGAFANAIQRHTMVRGNRMLALPEQLRVKLKNNEWNRKHISFFNFGYSFSSYTLGSLKSRTTIYSAYLLYWRFHFDKSFAPAIFE